MRLALAGIALLAAGAARAEPAPVQVSDHPGFGRVVFELPAATGFRIVEHGATRLVLAFPGGGPIGMPDRVPRNVVSVVGGEASATLMIAPGARVRSAQAGNRVVIDVLDRRGRPSPPPAAPPPLPTPTPEPAPPPGPPSAPDPVPPATAAATPSESEPAPAAPAPLRIAAGPAVGAAAFRREGVGVVVLDEPLPLGPGQLGTSFPGAGVSHAGSATVLTLPLAADESLALVREQAGWLVLRGKADGPAAAQTGVPDGILFQFAQPGRALAIRDPVTGQSLLVGTSRQAGGGGPLVAPGRSGPGYALLPTWAGVALAPTSDRVDLRVSTAGFTLVTPDSASPGKLAVSAGASRFGLPLEPVPILLRHLQAHLAGAASSPPRSRGPERVAAARVMLALGMAAEAQALLSLAAADDPSVAGDPATGALAGMAAVLAGRPGDASGLDAPALGDDDEVALWRGLRDLAQGKSAPSLATGVDLARRYPEAVQRRVLPITVEAALRAGEAATVQDLPDWRGLAFAHALTQERAGDTDAALAAYDALERRRDRSDSVRAALAAAELRLAAGRIAPAAAAELFERQTLRWRGDSRELATRLRLAELRTQAGLWRAALEGLRETEALFPEARSETGSRRAAVFTALLASPLDRLRPLDLVTLAGDFADSVPEGAAGQAIASLLADKLAALDLPSRAGPVLRKLMQQSAAEGAKAEFAIRLAQLHLDAGEPARAEAVLKEAGTAHLSAEQQERLGLVLARARAGQGDIAGSASQLTALASPAADALRAELLAKSGDWRGSLAALKDLAAKTVPEQGKLSDAQQDTVLREATAAVQAGDAAALAELQAFESRLASPRVDMFRLLTARAVQGPADLPRAARELAMARLLPSRLDALARR